MHDMNDLMVGMFWGGLVMAVPPVAVGVLIAVRLLRHQRAGRANERGTGAGTKM